MLRNIWTRQITGPINACIDVMAESILIDAMTRADPADGTLAGYGSEGIKSSANELFLRVGIQ